MKLRTLPRGGAAAKKALLAARARRKKVLAAQKRHRASLSRAKDLDAFARVGVALEAERRDAQLAQDDARAVLAVGKRPDLKREFAAYVKKRDLHAKAIVELHAAELALRDISEEWSSCFEDTLGLETPRSRKMHAAFTRAEKKIETLVGRAERTEHAAACELSALCSKAGV